MRNCLNFKFKSEDFYKFIIILFLCAIYIGNEYRAYFEVMFYFVFIIYFIEKRKPLTIFVFWNSLFVGFCAFSILWSLDTQKAMLETRIMLQWAIMGNLLIAFVDKEERLIDLYKYIVIAGCTLVIVLLYNFPLSIWLDGRLGSNVILGLNPNRVGLILAISAICAMYLGKHKNNKIYYLIVLIFTIVVMFSGSRKAFLMVVMGIVGIIYLSAPKSIKVVRSIFLVIILLLISYYLSMTVKPIYDVLGSRIETAMNAFIGQGDIDSSTIARLEMIEIGKELFKEKPFFGYGVGNYGAILGYAVYYSHNNYIELLVGLGLIGTIIYYSMYTYVIVKLFKVRELMHGNPLMVVVLLLLIMEYALVSYNGSVYQMMIALSFAATRILGNRLRQ